MKAVSRADKVGSGTALKLQPESSTAHAMIGTMRMASLSQGFPPFGPGLTETDQSIAVRGTSA